MFPEFGLIEVVVEILSDAVVIAGIAFGSLVWSGELVNVEKAGVIEVVVDDVRVSFADDMVMAVDGLSRKTKGVLYM